MKYQATLFTFLIQFHLRRFAVYTVPWNAMNIFEMTTKISTLSKSLIAELTLEWSLTSVLAEMIAKIAAFFKKTTTSFKAALEE